MILILDTVQPIVNIATTSESYGTYWKLIEDTTSLYVILAWSRICIIGVVCGLL